MDELPHDHDLTHLTRALAYVDKFRVAIDGGAHQGIWTKVLQKKFDTVYAFEPQPTNYEILTKNISSNVHAYNGALGFMEKFISLKSGPENTGQYYIDPDYPDNRSIPVWAIDDFQLKDVDFLKLDIEGYEIFALMGARRTIEKYKPVILIEENGLCERYDVKTGETHEFLLDLGYECVKRCGKDYIYVYR